MSESGDLRDELHGWGIFVSNEQLEKLAQIIQCSKTEGFEGAVKAAAVMAPVGAALGAPLAGVGAAWGGGLAAGVGALLGFKKRYNTCMSQPTAMDRADVLELLRKLGA